MPAPDNMNTNEDLNLYAKRIDFICRHAWFGFDFISFRNLVSKFEHELEVSEEEEAYMENLTKRVSLFSSVSFEE